MTTATYSSVLDHPVATVWALIRDFNNYPLYIEGVTDIFIEDDKAGDEIGAVRRFRYGDAELRQRLAALSDEDHRLTYAGCDPFEFPEGAAQGERPSPAAYEGTMRLLPIVDGDRTLIEWSVTVDDRPGEAEAWRPLLTSLITDWANSLRRALDRGVRG